MRCRLLPGYSRRMLFGRRLHMDALSFWLWLMAFVVLWGTNETHVNHQPTPVRAPTHPREDVRPFDVVARLPRRLRQRVLVFNEHGVVLPVSKETPPP